MGISIWQFKFSNTNSITLKIREILLQKLDVIRLQSVSSNLTKSVDDLIKTVHLPNLILYLYGNMILPISFGQALMINLS